MFSSFCNVNSKWLLSYLAVLFQDVISLCQLHLVHGGHGVWPPLTETPKKFYHLKKKSGYYFQKTAEFYSYTHRQFSQKEIKETNDGPTAIIPCRNQSRYL